MQQQFDLNRHGFRYRNQLEIDKRNYVHTAFDRVCRQFKSEAIELPLASDISDFLGNVPRPISERESNRLFQAIMPEGSPVAIRYEGTALVAKYVKALLSSKPETSQVRLHYFQEMLRIEQRSELDEKHFRAFHQAGVEFFNRNKSVHIGSMAELMALVIMFFDEIGLEIKLRISHVDVVQKVLNSVPRLTSAQRKLIREQLEKLPFEELEERLKEIGVPDMERNLLMNLKGLGVCTIDLAISLLTQFPSLYEATVNELTIFHNYLLEIGVAEKCLFDAGIHRSLRFYSGIVFQGDIVGMPECLGGGDFSGLVESFGYTQTIHCFGMAVGVERILNTTI